MLTIYYCLKIIKKKFMFCFYNISYFFFLNQGSAGYYLNKFYLVFFPSFTSPSSSPAAWCCCGGRLISSPVCGCCRLNSLAVAQPATISSKSCFISFSLIITYNRIRYFLVISSFHPYDEEIHHHRGSTMMRNTVNYVSLYISS